MKLQAGEDKSMAHIVSSLTFFLKVSTSPDSKNRTPLTRMTELDNKVHEMDTHTIQAWTVICSSVND